MLKVQACVKQALSMMSVERLKGSLFVTCVFSVIFLFSGPSMSENTSSPAQEFGITENNVFLYYKDYDLATKFYEETLGFKLVLTINTARMYHIANTSYVTPVRGDPEKHNLSSEKPVTLTLITDDLEAWRSYLSTNKVKILSKVTVEEQSLQRGFVALDPGGYYLNFVQYKYHPKNAGLLAILDKLSPVYVKPKGIGSDSHSLGIKATMTSFYYKDLKTIHKFYHEVLGFKKIVEQKHAMTYQTSASGFFRVVDGRHGFHRPIRGKALKKGSMMSFFTNNTVEGWFDFINKRKDVELRLPKMSDREQLKAFSFNDYEDYSVEFDYFPEAELNIDLRRSIENNRNSQSKKFSGEFNAN